MRFRTRLFSLALALFGSTLVGCGSGNSNGNGSPLSSLSEGITRAPTQRPGVQALLAHLWSSNSTGTSGSVGNFLSVFKSGNSYTAGPSKLAISFAPCLFQSTSNYVNARTILDKLIGAGKDVSVTIFLDRGNDIHKAGTGEDSNMELSAKEFSDNFLKIYAGRAALSVCPSLEDNANKADMDRWAVKIWNKLDQNYRSYVAFRRNPNVSSSGAYDGYLPSQGSYRAVQLELHGQVAQRITASAAYSNDGLLVGKSAETLTDASGRDKPAYLSVPSFASEIRKYGYTGTVLLWRPAYNLFVRVPKSNGVTNFDRTIRLAIPSDAQTSFDATEIQALKDFFNS